MEGKKDTSIVEEARIHFEGALRSYFKNFDNEPPRDNGGILNVLSVGCGHGLDAGGVSRVFPKSKYKGIDIDPDLITSAKRFNSDLGSYPAEFVQEDAVIVPDGERNKYGLVIIRNPQPGGTIKDIMDDINSQSSSARRSATDLWKTILNSSMEKAVDNGYLFITTDIIDDEQMIKEFLDEKKVQYWELRNPEIPLSGMVLRDSVIIIGRVKKSET